MLQTSILLWLACLLPVVLAVSSLLVKSNHRVFSALLFAEGLLIAFCAVLSWNHTIDVQLPGWLAVGWIPLSLKCDTLASLFLLLLGVVSACSAAFSSEYLSHIGDKISPRLYWCTLYTFILGMVLVILSANAVTFLVAWELMSLSSALLVVSDYKKHKAQRAAFIYIVATRIATIFLTAGFLLMCAKFQDLSFSVWTFTDRETWLPAALILTGLIIKAGIWPFHIWLPYAHPEAPSPVSALMSGVMVKIAVYAAVRFFVFGHLTCSWIIYALFFLSAVSAFWGVLFAINQRELKRLLAYSTVENVGLIFLCLALSMCARNSEIESISQLALIGVLLHTFGHGLFKSLLFLCAGSVDYAAHSRDFAMLGGLNKRMPVTGAAFILGSAAACALPPLNGFTTKWCLYQSLLQSSFTMPTLLDRAICFTTIGILSCVGALAIACFAKAIGVAFLGKPRSHKAGVAREVPFCMYAPLVLLAAVCLLMGFCVQWLVRPLAPILLVIGKNPPLNIFDPIPLWQVGVILVPFLLLIYLIVLRRPPASFKTWDCGFGESSSKSQVTADSFAQPIARIFTPVLRYHLTVDISGQDRRHFPEKIVVEPDMVSLLETKVYGPAAQIVDRISKVVAKLQAGSIHLYLTYMCIALIILIMLGTRI